jgi:hypothetical protein
LLRDQKDDGVVIPEDSSNQVIVLKGFCLYAVLDKNTSKPGEVILAEIYSNGTIEYYSSPYTSRSENSYEDSSGTGFRHSFSYQPFFNGKTDGKAFRWKIDNAYIIDEIRMMTVGYGYHENDGMTYSPELNQFLHQNEISRDEARDHFYENDFGRFEWFLRTGYRE